MSNTMILVIAISVLVVLLACNLLRTAIRLRKSDGRLVIDDEHDSFYVAIRTCPSKLKKRKTITLIVYHK